MSVLVDQVTDGIQNATNTIDTVTRSAINGTANVLSSAVDTSARGTNSLIDGTASVAKDVVDATKGLMESGIGLIQHGLNSTASAINNVVGNVTQVVDHGAYSTDSIVSTGMTSFVKSYPWVLIILKIIIILYAAKIAPTVPLKYASIFSNVYFRISILALIVWTYSHDPVASVLIAVAFFMSINYLRQNAVNEVKQTGVITTHSEVAMNQGSKPENQKKIPGVAVYNPNDTINTPLADASGSVKPVTAPIPHTSLVAANIPMETQQLADVNN
jgi:hypothetical protein